MALEATDVLDGRPTFKAGQPFNVVGYFRIHELLVAEDDAGYHLLAMYFFQGRADDVKPACFPSALGAALSVTAQPERGTDGILWHAQQFFDLPHVLVFCDPFVPAG